MKSNDDIKNMVSEQASAQVEHELAKSQLVQIEEKFKIALSNLSNTNDQYRIVQKMHLEFLTSLSESQILMISELFLLSNDKNEKDVLAVADKILASYEKLLAEFNAHTKSLMNSIEMKSNDI